MRRHRRARTERCNVYVMQFPSGQLYVGSTCKTVKQRAAEHRKRRPGARLRRELFRNGQHAMSREAAEKIEKRLARKLRQRGYKVRQG